MENYNEVNVVEETEVVENNVVALNDYREDSVESKNDGALMAVGIGILGLVAAGVGVIIKKNKAKWHEKRIAKMKQKLEKEGYIVASEDELDGDLDEVPGESEE